MISIILFAETKSVSQIPNKDMKKLDLKLIGTIIFIFSMVTNAYATVPLSGKIIEKATENPLEFANIVLLSLPDSTFVTGTTSNVEGVFKFENLDRGKYLIKISYIGLEYKNIPVELIANPVHLGDIQLEESNVLRDVVITSKIPPFQSGVNGGIVANVSTTLLSTVGTASDVLQRMPGVVAEGGRITVFGKGSPIVYINNRKIQDVSELERLESTEISTVELITNPGAKYDAEGRAVLLVKTKSKINGFSAQLTERLRTTKYLGNNENISISYTKNNLSLFASYFHNKQQGVESENHFFNLKEGNNLWQHWSDMPKNKYSANTQQIASGFDLSINEEHAIGGQYQFYTGNTHLNFPIISNSQLNGEPYDLATSFHSLKINPDNI